MRHRSKVANQSTTSLGEMLPVCYDTPYCLGPYIIDNFSQVVNIDAVDPILILDELTDKSD